MMCISDVLFLILVTTGGAWSYLIPCRFITPEPKLCIHWLGGFVGSNVARMQWEGIEPPSSRLPSSYYKNDILLLKIVEQRFAT
jgi:hypothetical protein